MLCQLADGSIFFNLPVNPKTPVVKRRKKQKIPRITRVGKQANGTEDPARRENKEAEETSRGKTELQGLEGDVP